MTTIHRNDGTKLATLTDDGDKAIVTMYAPDGYSGRAAAWLLSVEELDRLTDAQDKLSVELHAKRGHAPAA